eukprot:TRINITY_DN30880_c0_g1_i1.p2 TRINITY_DN30880_c0_g1~~TRINITY_DN30880_c0_g1_i1.p2  ORF type:complete len:226 (-),score=65.15 TRINITY_DN30880_c0_g1_i1:55-732(-)
MPKNKRNKVVSLTKTKKKPRDNKDKLIEEIREHCSKAARVYLLAIENERNSFLQEVRKQLRPGILVNGRNKVMQLALGTTPESECQDGVHKIAEMITGHSALLFTDKAPAEVQGFFAKYHPSDYARSGQTATETVTLARGTDALAKLPHSIEAHLRQLGLPTQLVEGRIHLLGDHTVCKAGDSLTTDAAQVLKLLEIKQSQFSVNVEAHWARETGAFVDCTALED